MLKLTNQPLSHIPLFPREMRRRERHFASPPLVSQVVWKVLERKLHAAWSTSPSSPPPSLRICNEVSSSYQATKKSTGAERPLPGETSSTCRVYVIVFDYKKFLRVAARVGVRSPPPPKKTFSTLKIVSFPKLSSISRLVLDSFRIEFEKFPSDKNKRTTSRKRSDRFLDEGRGWEELDAAVIS